MMVRLEFQSQILYPAELREHGRVLPEEGGWFVAEALREFSTGESGDASE